MRLAHFLILPALIYISGLVLYSRLFVFSDNQSDFAQSIKVLVSASYSLFFLFFVYAAQAKYFSLKIFGYIGLCGYFGYAFFLLGYFSYFGFIPEIYSFGTSNASDMRDVLAHYFLQVFGVREVLLVICFFLVLWALPRFVLQRSSVLFLCLPFALLFASLYSFGNPKHSDKFGNETVIRRFGIPAFIMLSSQEWFSFTSGYVAENTDFPGKVGDLIADNYVRGEDRSVAPNLSVKHVVLIQIESLDREALGATLNGREVMPFVSGLRDKDCIEYTNFYTTKSVGGSADVEFSVMTGRLPSSKVQSLRNADFSKVETIYDYLEDYGISSYFTHNNNAGFYGRNSAYRQLSSVSSKFLNPLEIVGETEFVVSAVMSAVRSSPMSFHYFFNFKSHGPFRGYSSTTQSHFNLEGLNSLADNYLATMYEVDGTIEKVFEVVQKEFDSGELLLLITSDHPSYLHTSQDFINQNNIPFLACHLSFDAQKNGKVSSPIDVYPTIIEAFGLPQNERLIGENMFEGEMGVVLFPNGTILYNREADKLQTQTCNSDCEKLFNYGDQIIRVR